jgi:hypothetical protein
VPIKERIGLVMLADGKIAFALNENEHEVAMN